MEYFGLLLVQSILEIIECIEEHRFVDLQEVEC